MATLLQETGPPFFDDTDPWVWVQQVKVGGAGDFLSIYNGRYIRSLKQTAVLLFALKGRQWGFRALTYNFACTLFIHSKPFTILFKRNSNLYVQHPFYQHFNMVLMVCQLKTKKGSFCKFAAAKTNVCATFKQNPNV